MVQELEKDCEEMERDFVSFRKEFDSIVFKDGV
jgi:hypothetical protein